MYGNLQQALQKATFAMVTPIDKLLATKYDPKSTSVHLNEMISNVDVVALLGYTAYKSSHLRREKLKPVLKPEYHVLCSSEDYIIY